MFTPLNAKRFETPKSDLNAGPAPQLQWLPVVELFVDHSYQRQIGRRGAQNVRLIAEHFDWTKFAPVIVAPIEGGSYAIVDGQHRSTAAMLRGIEKVPCQVVPMDRATQAAAFAAVNGSVTKILPGQLFWARVASGNEAAKSVQAVCDAAGVTIARTNLVNAKMKVGQTHAIGKITRCIELYGPDATTAALRCITMTADGNAGFLRSTIIEALTKVLHKHPNWRDSEKSLHAAMESWCWPDVWGQITNDQAKIFPHTALDMVVSRLEKFLTKRFEQMAKKKAA